MAVFYPTLSNFLYSYLDVIFGAFYDCTAALKKGEKPGSSGWFSGSSWVEIHINAILGYFFHFFGPYFFEILDNAEEVYTTKPCSYKGSYIMASFVISGLFFTLTVLTSFLCINRLGLYGSFVITTTGLSIF
jgi:hypothetical protein